MKKTPIKRRTKEAFCWIVEILRGLHIPFLITGGFAAKLYGSRRQLADIDIDIADKSLIKIKGFVEPWITFGPARFTDIYWDIRLMTLRYKGQLIDLTEASGSLRDKKTKQKIPIRTNFNRRVIKTVYGLHIPVMPKPLLIQYKNLLLRPVDQRDLRAMGVKI
ncbi:MAG: hypothetical protein Q8Q39_03965 [bacterium]|nr:hypothetical protein [bacterium]